MKKLLLTITFIAAVFSLFAQESPYVDPMAPQEQHHHHVTDVPARPPGLLVSKKGIPILPQEGEYALGFDALPFFSYLGSLFSDDGSESPEPQFTANNPGAIFVKYMMRDDLAVRARVRLGFGTQSQDYFVADDLDTVATNPTMLNDVVRPSGTNILLGIGVEKRRGISRVQGYIGPEVFVSYNASSTENTFANAFSAVNVAPTTAIPGQGGTARTTKLRSGSTISAGVRAFIGVEYFIAPKVSIGGEFGWAISFSSTGEGEMTREYFDFANNTIVTETNSITSRSTSFGFDNDNSGGALNLTFYF